MFIHERDKATWELKELHPKIFLVEYVSSKTQRNSKFSEQDETNIYTQYMFITKPKAQENYKIW